MKIKINPKYEEMRSFIERIPDVFEKEGMKSCELTGIWEKKLRDIEHKTYDPADFINGLKEQINKRVTIMTEEDLKKKPAAKKPSARKAPAKKADKAAAQNADSQNAPAQQSQAAYPMVGKTCPLGGKVVIIKGKTAYGCSNWKAGCQYRQPFSQMQPNIKRCTPRHLPKSGLPGARWL